MRHRRLRIGDRVKFPDDLPDGRKDVGTVVLYEGNGLIICWDLPQPRSYCIDIDTVSRRGRTSLVLHGGVFVIPTGHRYSKKHVRLQLLDAEASWRL